MKHYEGFMGDKAVILSNPSLKFRLGRFLDTDLEYVSAGINSDTIREIVSNPQFRSAFLQNSADYLTLGKKQGKVIPEENDICVEDDISAVFLGNNPPDKNEPSLDLLAYSSAGPNLGSFMIGGTIIVPDPSKLEETYINFYRESLYAFMINGPIVTEKFLDTRGLIVIQRDLHSMFRTAVEQLSHLRTRKN